MDTQKKLPLQDDMQFASKQTIPTKKCHNLLPFLRLYKDLKVMPTDQILLYAWTCEWSCWKVSL